MIGVMKRVTTSQIVLLMPWFSICLKLFTVRMANNLDDSFEVLSQHESNQQQSSSEMSSSTNSSMFRNTSMCTKQCIVCTPKTPSICCTHNTNKCNNKLCKSCTKLPLLHKAIEEKRLSQIVIICPMCSPKYQSVHKIILQLCEKHTFK